MTPLEVYLREMIAKTGPISVYRFMTKALMHPDYGYYRKNDPLGQGRDFITAPEISQIFGELIGLWLADRWDAMGRPSLVRLVELGPGRGTLMADALRALSVVPNLREAVSVHFVESNMTLRAAQEKQVARKIKTTWHDQLSDVPLGPTLLIANEFFDALPIRQFVRSATGWAERVVTVGDNGFEFSLGPEKADTPPVPESLLSVAPGSIVEICPAARDISAEIGRRLSAYGGAALVIDYGYRKSAAGDSLQAIRRHQYVDVFHRPGESDLTAHVNFEDLAKSATDAGGRVFGPVRQGAFLCALGIELRAAMLKRRATHKQKIDIDAAVRRLTSSDMMGDLFKVMAIQSMLTVPSGFEGVDGG